MTDRELRLRQRIDKITDERDRARDESAIKDAVIALRDEQLVECRQANYKRGRRIYAVVRSREFWRHRATNR